MDGVLEGSEFSPALFKNGSGLGPAHQIRERPPGSITPGAQPTRPYSQMGRRLSDGGLNFQSMDTQSWAGSMVWSTSDYAVPNIGHMMYPRPVPMQMQGQPGPMGPPPMQGQPGPLIQGESIAHGHPQNFGPQHGQGLLPQEQMTPRSMGPSMGPIPKAHSRQSLDICGRNNTGGYITSTLPRRPMSNQAAQLPNAPTPNRHEHIQHQQEPQKGNKDVILNELFEKPQQRDTYFNQNISTFDRRRDPSELSLNPVKLNQNKEQTFAAGPGSPRISDGFGPIPEDMFHVPNKRETMGPRPQNPDPVYPREPSTPDKALSDYPDKNDQAPIFDGQVVRFVKAKKPRPDGSQSSGKKLCILQIILGCILFGLGVARLMMFAVWGIGVEVVYGVFVALSGVLGLIGTRKANYCSVVACFVMCTLSCILAIWPFITGLMVTVPETFKQFMNSYNKQYFTSDTEPYAVDILLSIICLVEVLVAAIISALGCRMVGRIMEN